MPTSFPLNKNSFSLHRVAVKPELRNKRLFIPELPAEANAQTLRPLPKKFVVLHVVPLESDFFAVSESLSVALARYAGLIPNIGVAFARNLVRFVNLDTANLHIKAIADIAQKPGHTTSIGPEETITWPTLKVPSVTVTAVVWRLKPTQPIWQPTVFVAEDRQHRRN